MTMKTAMVTIIAVDAEVSMVRARSTHSQYPFKTQVSMKTDPRKIDT
jgi:hypothetical protein